MARKQKSDQLKKRRLLLLCEGESEITYFNLLRAEFKIKKSLLEIESKPSKNLENIIEDLKKKKSLFKDKKPKYQEIHLIIDKESLSNIKRQRSYTLFNKDIKKLNKEFSEKDLKIKIITSFISFEFWLLLHFSEAKDTDFRKLHNIKELKKELSKFYRNYIKGNKTWLENAIFTQKSKKNNVNLAIERAKKIRYSDNNNSWTHVHQTAQQIINNSNSVRSLLNNLQH